MPTFYIQSFHMTEYFSPERALSVRLYVCVCVCASVTAFYLNTIRPILMKLEPYDLNKILRWHFSQILKMLIQWRHSGHFICFRMRHSHGRNFASILFKIIDKKLCCLPMFAIENQQNRSITSGRKSGPRLRKIAFLVFKPVSEVPGSNPGGDRIFATWFLLLCFQVILIIRKKIKYKKWLNILLTLWCSCYRFEVADDDYRQN